MTMGERLRQAREEAGLSQRQVCGDQITRNQLSQLEHDRVGPSVETLRYLARQLGKPVSYFLGEISPNLQILQEVRTTQDPEQALHRLAGYRPMARWQTIWSCFWRRCCVWQRPIRQPQREGSPMPGGWLRRAMKR